MPNLKKILLNILILSLLWPAQMICAQETEDNLVRISLSIFPKLVAVDLGMKDKLTANGQIQLLIYYDNKKELAYSVAEQLRKQYPRIAAFPVKVEARSAFAKHPPTAILLVEHLDEMKLKKVIDYGVANHILVFSPFKEDVDRGVTAGMYVAIRIHPYFNRDTLKRSKIKMHKILLSSAKFYE